jgi:uncharacterized protein YfeS
VRKFNNIWDITPESAHPRARDLIGQSIIWDYGDDDSPLGNDTGADTFCAYLTFRTRRPEGKVHDFIHEHFAARGIANAGWDTIDERELKKIFDAHDGVRLVRRDDFIIGLAFAQLLLEGGVDPVVRDRALTALRRQATNVVLSFHGGGGEEGRKVQLAEFRRILALAVQ